VSDFISASGWQKPLNLLNHRHEVIAARLSDPREADLPDIGMVLIEDSETGEQMYLDTSDARFRKRFNDSAQKREYNLNVAFRQAGVDPLSLSTEQDLVQAIVRFAGVRKERKRHIRAIFA
jgi:uncharacterized protein (DUF58 family)